VRTGEFVSAVVGILAAWTIIARGTGVGVHGTALGALFLIVVFVLWTHDREITDADRGGMTQEEWNRSW
jgi:hypothetical protein